MERKIGIMCPSRNRRQSVEVVYQTWIDTNSGNSEFFPVIDADNIDEYEPRIPGVEYIVAPPKNMNYATNFAANILKDRFTHIMFIGDDHHFRTPSWDSILLDKSAQYNDTVVMYCDDLLQCERLATEVVITSNIVEALGYFSLPELKHMFMDNYWMELGRLIGRLVYVPEVKVEHMHPAVGKAKVDDGYLRVWDTSISNYDQGVFTAWANGGQDETINKLRPLL